MNPDHATVLEAGATVDHCHGVAVHDPYRWLEDGDAPRTRTWIDQQVALGRSFLDALPARAMLKERVTELLRVDTLPQLHRFADRWFFLRRLADEDQASIYTSLRLDGLAERLVDPRRFGNPATSVQLVDVSPDGRWLAYAVKTGATGWKAVEILDLATKTVLEDRLPTGFLRGFAFTADSTGFYYVRQGIGEERPLRAVHHHALGESVARDRVVWTAGEDASLRLAASFPEHGRWGVYIVVRAGRWPTKEYYLHDLASSREPSLLLTTTHDDIDLAWRDGRWLVCTNHHAPNRLIGWSALRDLDLDRLEVIVPERGERIQHWTVHDDRLVVSYISDMATRLTMVGFDGTPLGDLPLPVPGTAHVLPAMSGEQDIYFIHQSFTQPPALCAYSPSTAACTAIARESARTVTDDAETRRIWFDSTGDVRVHMFLVGRPGVFDGGPVPVVLTGYGASGNSLTPQFSQLATMLIEHDGIFAVANVRGGSELGAAWYEAGRGRARQNAIDDVLAAAEWLIAAGLTTPDKLALAGGSNSGTLVAAAMTQRPELFRAVLCLAPLLDMLRYHKFENTQFHVANLGNPDDPEDFHALAAYSPYHNVRDGVPYPAVFLLSGDADTRCDPMHARKMTARLQAATSSPRPILLHYSTLAGHSGGLPLSLRIESLTDRIAFLWNQLGIASRGAEAS